MKPGCVVVGVRLWVQLVLWQCGNSCGLAGNTHLLLLSEA